MGTALQSHAIQVKDSPFIIPCVCVWKCKYTDIQLPSASYKHYTYHIGLPLLQHSTLPPPSRVHSPNINIGDARCRRRLAEVIVPAE
ncbi:hypothetical protein E2C01_004168 [Portunus trituberculatus]|uniref:Uncharacterized protein n=1 Tax=Portunus trituberculatus TaxID=210409 RepID=A0A5B7CRP4_PORTR|nr:hypothetical protein [Portunus trituberculatus]